MNEKETNTPRLRKHNEKKCTEKTAAPEITDHLSELLGGQILKCMLV